MTDPNDLTADDVAQIIEGIDCFIIEDFEDLVPIWQPYIDKLKRLKKLLETRGIAHE